MPLWQWGGNTLFIGVLILSDNIRNVKVNILSSWKL